MEHENKNYMEMDMMCTSPQLGDMCPEMQVSTTHGMKNIPSDYSGRWLVLFSHPGDFTPVCTTEFVTFSQKADEFKKLSTELVGLSVDQLEPHLKWVEWINENTDTTVPFPIIADGMGEYAKMLGMVHPNKGSRAVRKVFIIDPKGVIRLTMTYPPEVGRCVDEILRAVGTLQTCDKYKMVAPENYPNNAWLKDALMLPAPSSEQMAASRMQNQKSGGYSCMDWWICYKNMNNGYNNNNY